MNEGERTWSFLTSHAHVLLCVSHDPATRIRDLATKVGITERRAQGIVSDLVKAGYLKKEKVGRRNRYVVRADLPLRHPLWKDTGVGEILKLKDRPDSHRNGTDPGEAVAPRRESVPSDPGRE
jgi:hypothetical protein